MIKNEADVRELIHQRWKLGIKPDGTIIGFYHNKGYAFEKAQKNPLAGYLHVDLIDTGALWKGIKLSPFGESIEVYSTDGKYFDISEKYGDANFNLSPEETKRLLDTVSAAVMMDILNKAYK